MNQKLQKEIRESILERKNFEKEVERLTEILNQEAAEANSEATIALRMEEILRELLNYFGVSFLPDREVVLKTEQKNCYITAYRKSTSRRIDSRFQNIITEYKKNIHSHYEENVKQLTDYMELAAETEEQKIDKYYGILTDGREIVFISYSGQKRILSQPQKLCKKSMKELLKIYLSLGRKELSPRQLVKDFSISARDSVSLQMAKAFYDDLINRKEVIVSEWNNLFQLGGHNDNNVKSIKERKRVLAGYFQTEEARIDESAALFALQTTYTIILKLIAYNVIVDIYLKKKDFSLDFFGLSGLPADILQNRMREIDSGDMFEQMGFTNLLETDFFSWYLEKPWKESQTDPLRRIMEVLDEYDVGQRLFGRENVHDFFKELYQSLIPKEVRHSLGEYYTEDWLADHVIRHRISKVGKKDDWRAIDPCCGSGTFVMKLIEQLLEQNNLLNRSLVETITERIQGHDLNPLAVLTCKINYFLVLSRFLDPEEDREITIPVRIGDSALVPRLEQEEETRLVSYEVALGEQQYRFALPLSVFQRKDAPKIFREFVRKLESQEENPEVLFFSEGQTSGEQEIAAGFVKQCNAFLKDGHSLYWIKTVLSILTTRTIGKFDFIASNPPWIDWKALPDGYRETLKAASIEHHIFSGDRFTGGINLNICALIANVAANTWLKEGGIMGILMPKSLIFQSTYKGFRNLVQTEGGPLTFESFVDWTYAGNPFKGVTEKFMTYYLRKEEEPETQKEDGERVPVLEMIKQRGARIDDKKYRSYEDVRQKYRTEEKEACQVSRENNHFTIISLEDAQWFPWMKIIAGVCSYRGRVGLGLYPKEAFLMEIEKTICRYGKELALVRNYQNPRSERKVLNQPSLLEKEMLCPVIEGPNIEKFKVRGIRYVAPFPYRPKDVKKPIPAEELQETAPHLLKYFRQIKEDIKKTEYNQRVQGKKGEFYSLTRVGTYTFAKNKVVFRNNTKWNAAVIEETDPVYRDYRMYLLLDHACSISQTRKGREITAQEAHYLCALLNSTPVERYIVSSSDARSFKADIPVSIPEFQEDNPLHQKLAEASRRAHKEGISEELQREIDETVKELYKGGSL